MRIGTADIYRFAESHPLVADSIAIGCPTKGGRRSGDIDVVLFVVLDGGKKLSQNIQEEIRSVIRQGASEAHVPHIIRQVAAIPYTKSGKKVEITVRDLFQGIEPKNIGALVDPSVLDEFRAIKKKGLL